MVITLFFIKSLIIQILQNNIDENYEDGDLNKVCPDIKLITMITIKIIIIVV